MKQKNFIVGISILLCLCSFSCTCQHSFLSQQEQRANRRAMLYPVLYKVARSFPYNNEKIELVYFCSVYELKSKKNKETEICACYLYNKNDISSGSTENSFVIKTKKSYLYYFDYDIFVTDKDFIFNEIYPLCDERTKKELEYSYSDNRDTIFKNIIDYEHKVIFDSTHYYYPVNLSRAVNLIYVNNNEWFFSIFPISSWIPIPNCVLNISDMSNNININIRVPTLEIPTLKKEPKKE
jgi:hypothetical protein